MQLILRKSDSATNLLFFIYKFNSYFNPAGEPRLKLSTILAIMKLFGKNETNVRVALSRAIKSDLFINIKEGNEVYYTPTQYGKKIIDKLVYETKCLFKRYKLRNSSWDQKWLCVYMAKPQISTKEKVDEIVEGLKTLGFAPMANNTLISPYNLTNEINHMMNELEFKKGLFTIFGEMTVKINNEELTQNVFKIHRYTNSYLNFTGLFGEKLAELKERNRTGSIIAKEFSIPLFYELGSSFFDFAMQDPFLPREILPDWEGDKAASIMVELYEILTPSVRFHFNELL